MEIKVPEWMVKNFNSMIKKFTKKGIDVKVKDLGEGTVKINDINYFCHVYDVDNELSYQVPGWEFVGTIEHKENGNVIRTIRDTEIPERYLTATAECEHCNTIRDRKDTYLVRNTSSNEFKQVGRSCLLAYTGLNPAVCAYAMDIENILNNFEDEVEHSAPYRSARAFDCEEVKKIAYDIVKQFGFIPAGSEDSTGNKVRDLYFTDFVPKTTEQDIKEVDEWANSLDDSNNNFIHNSKVIYNSKDIEGRDIGILSAFINMFFKDQTKKAKEAAAPKKESEYVGSVGDKIIIKPESVRSLYSLDPYAYGASISTVYELVGDDGNVFIYRTTQNLDDINNMINKEVRATVKDHKEYRGVKQTVITRAKII